MFGRTYHTYGAELEKIGASTPAATFDG